VRKGTVVGVVLILSAVGWAQTSPPSVTFYRASDLRKAIATAPEQPGQPGLFALRLSSPSDPEVVGIRRTTAARSELHANITDVWYVIDGNATLVTGGTMEDGIETTSGEIRGHRLVGGKSRDIKKGDYAVIPAGIPHWISKVAGKDFLYIVVKVPVATTSPRRSSPIHTN